MYLKKIISGGQTGADQAGLAAAVELGLETGGFAPYGWRTDEGPNPSLAGYGLIQLNVSSYPSRTAANISISDGTVIFVYAEKSIGSRLTERLCRRAKKPVLVLDYVNELHRKMYPYRLRKFVIARKIETLNVAGNREKSCPGTYAMVFNVIMEAFRPLT